MSEAPASPPSTCHNQFDVLAALRVAGAARRCGSAALPRSARSARPRSSPRSRRRTRAAAAARWPARCSAPCSRRFQHVAWVLGVGAAPRSARAARGARAAPAPLRPPHVDDRGDARAQLVTAFALTPRIDRDPRNDDRARSHSLPDTDPTEDRVRPPARTVEWLHARDARRRRWD